MSSKVELQRKLNEIGYEYGPFASKDTLSNVMRLHSVAVESKGINVAELNDHDLRKSLTESNHTVGPVTSHTRSIYQRKLLEILTDETSEGKEDEIEVDEPKSLTPPPPPRTSRMSIARNGETNGKSSPACAFIGESQEPRIPLTRVDIDDRNARNLSSYHSQLATNKPVNTSMSEQTVTHSLSPQRSSTKTETRTSTASYGLRNPYDFQSDEPVVIRHEHKATPFRTTNIAPSEIPPTNGNRYVQPSTRGIFNGENGADEIRSRVVPSTVRLSEPRVNKETPSQSTSSANELEKKKTINSDKLDVATKNGGTILYGGITIAVALVVFVLYLWLEK